MPVKNKYWIILLSAVFSLGSVFHLCCHAQMNGAPVSTENLAAHHAQSDHSKTEQCDCGHELVKEFQKTKKAGSSYQFTFSPVKSRASEGVAFSLNRTGPFRTIQRSSLSYSSPPLHILNSVFLN